MNAKTLAVGASCSLVLWMPAFRPALQIYKNGMLPEDPDPWYHVREDNHSMGKFVVRNASPLPSGR